ncbi:MAG: hypothetical protein NTV92_06790, partial [Candidatus Bipolaricaulota bacterium]|nr:hypothetical protein [Candidatus Bipolaricaulota bacterium]
TLDVENSAPSPPYAAGNAWGSGSNRGAAAALVSPGVSLQESAWKGTIVIGTETGDVQEILGHLVRILLAGAGYHVVHLIGMGTAPRVEDAIQTGDIDLGTLEPKDTETSPAAAGLTAFVLPARVGWVAVVSQAVADRLPERSLSALSAMLRDAGQSVLWAIPQAFDEHAATALRDAYELDGQVRAVVWAKTLDEAESILTFGAAEFALLEDLEETVTLSGFVSLEDNLHVLPSDTLAVLVRTESLARNSDVGDALSRLITKLTTSALRDLLGRVRFSNQSPEDAAMEFLTHEGLLTD